MAGSSGAFRNVRFAEPEVKREGAGLLARLGRMFFCRKKRQEPPAEAAAAPREPEPFIISEPVLVESSASAPVEAKPSGGAGMKSAPKEAEAGLGTEAEKVLASLPHLELGYSVRESLRRAAARAGGPLSACEAREAVARDESADEELIAARRSNLLRHAFKSKQEFFQGRKVLNGREIINALYFSTAHFIRMIGAMGVRPDAQENESLRAKGEDREDVLIRLERALDGVAMGDRLEAFRLIAEMSEKMRDVLCSKEVCERIVKYCDNLETFPGDKMRALRAIADFVENGGVKPSGKDMRSGIPRAEETRIAEWLRARPAETRKLAEAVAERGRPRSIDELMQMLETDPDDEVEKRSFVGEQVLGRWTNTQKEFDVLGGLAARNVAYYCINDLLSVTSLADGMKDEEQIKKSAVGDILDIARRMPEGRRMEAPAIIAGLVRVLLDGKRAKRWIVTDWLAELRAYAMEPDKERAYRKLARIRMLGNPMEIFD